MKLMLILTASMALFAFGFYIGTQNTIKSNTVNETALIKANSVIDSLRSNRDTLILKEYETKIKWKVRTFTDSIYIVNAHDTLQPAIRANLRHRYDNL